MMFVRFTNQDTSWMYTTEAVIALVGDDAAKRFRDVTWTVGDLETAFPLICMDISSDKEEDRLPLCRTDMLFVLCELERAEDVQIARTCAAQITARGVSFLITHKKEAVNDEVSEAFTHVICVEDEAVNLFYPAKQLLCDYYRLSYVGSIDMADVYSVFPQDRRISYFLRKTCADLRAMKRCVRKLRKAVEEKKNAEGVVPDMLLILEIPRPLGLEMVDRTVRTLGSQYEDGALIWKANFNACPNDGTYTLMLQMVFPR